MMSDTEKPLIWIASSYKDLMELPNEINVDLGTRFHWLSRGCDTHRPRFCVDLVDQE